MGNGTVWSPERRWWSQRQHGSALERFERLIEPDLNSGCWIWGGTLVQPDNYGHIEINGERWSAHRLSFTLFKGAIPDGLLVCHWCDTPPCVNPAHLFAGTYQDNIRDMHAKGRARRCCGSLSPHAKLTEAAIPLIRLRLAAGASCRAIGEDFGVSADVINAIRRGRSWKHVE
jgi:hypothetical protein